MPRPARGCVCPAPRALDRSFVPYPVRTKDHSSAFRAGARRHCRSTRHRRVAAFRLAFPEPSRNGRPNSAALLSCILNAAYPLTEHSARGALPCFWRRAPRPMVGPTMSVLRAFTPSEKSTWPMAPHAIYQGVLRSVATSGQPLEMTGQSPSSRRPPDPRGDHTHQFTRARAKGLLCPTCVQGSRRSAPAIGGLATVRDRKLQRDRQADLPRECG